MSQRHKEIITRQFKELVENLNTESILPTLVSEAIITVDEVEQIMKQSTRRLQAMELVQLLLRKEDRAFNVLVTACKENAMRHIANCLEKAGIVFHMCYGVSFLYQKYYTFE